MTSVSRSRKGFTLIELLTVIAIIGVLAAVLFPGVQGVMRSAKKNSALNKLRSIGQGYMNWAQGGKVMTRTGTWTAAGNVATKTSEYAANLAAGAALDSGELWFVDGDAMLERNSIPNLPKNVIRTSAGVIAIDPLFIAAITAGTGGMGPGNEEFTKQTAEAVFSTMDYGFVRVQVTTKESVIQFIDEAGRVRDSVTVPRT